jgi:hypothetical protein
LLALNHERYEEEVKMGLHGKGKKRKKRKAKGGKKKRGSGGAGEQGSGQLSFLDE